MCSSGGQRVSALSPYEANGAVPLDIRNETVAPLCACNVCVPVHVGCEGKNYYYIHFVWGWVLWFFGCHSSSFVYLSISHTGEPTWRTVCEFPLTRQVVYEYKCSRRRRRRRATSPFPTKLKTFTFNWLLRWKTRTVRRLVRLVAADEVHYIRWKVIYCCRILNYVLLSHVAAIVRSHVRVEMLKISKFSLHFLDPARDSFFYSTAFFSSSRTLMERSYEKAEERSWETPMKISIFDLTECLMHEYNVTRIPTRGRAPLLAFLLIVVVSFRCVVNIRTASNTGNWMSKMQSFTFAQKFSFHQVADIAVSSAAAYRSLLRFERLGTAIEVLWLGGVWKLSFEPLKFVRALTCHYHWFGSFLYLTMALRL